MQQPGIRLAYWVVCMYSNSGTRLQAEIEDSTLSLSFFSLSAHISIKYCDSTPEGRPVTIVDLCNK